jgi:hypothetical protein
VLVVVVVVVVAVVVVVVVVVVFHFSRYLCPHVLLCCVAHTLVTCDL